MEHMSDKDIDSLAATSKRMHKLAEGPLRKAKLRYFYSKGLTDDMLEFLTGVSTKDARAQVGSKEHFRPSDGVLLPRFRSDSYQDLQHLQKLWLYYDTLMPFYLLASHCNPGIYLRSRPP